MRPSRGRGAKAWRGCGWRHSPITWVLACFISGTGSYWGAMTAIFILRLMRCGMRFLCFGICGLGALSSSTKAKRSHYQYRSGRGTGTQPRYLPKRLNVPTMLVHDLCGEKSPAFGPFFTVVTYRKIFIFPIGNSLAALFLYILINYAKLVVVDRDVHPDGP